MTRSAFAVGETVDRRFALKREIARGGMCVVHEAEHQHLGMRVAIKSLTEEAGGLGGAETRLLREARALAMCRHPNVVEVLDAGLDTRGGEGQRAFVALEMLEGRSLDGILATRRTLELPTALAIAISLASALERAHEVGVVHRDVKPSNVYIAWDTTGAERVRLIDFGVASLGPSAPDGRKLTRPGEQLGTYEYMSPEQLFGEAVDYRADIYGLGVTLYELLIGEVPFAGGYAQAVKAILAGELPVSLVGRVPGATEALDSAVRRSIAREPSARFPSMAALGDALRAVSPGAVAQSLLGPRPRAVRPSTGVEARRFRRAPFVTPVRLLREGKPAVDGRSEDISERGLLVIAQSRVDDGENVQVRFSLPSSGQLITTPAVARWGKTARVHAALGLELTGLSDEQAADVRRFVDLVGA